MRVCKITKEISKETVEVAYMIIVKPCQAQPVSENVQQSWIPTELDFNSLSGVVEKKVGVNNW